MKQEKEIRVVGYMVKLYCRSKHGSKRGQLCKECAELMDYIILRRERCRFGDEKPFCANCKVQCYKPDMKEKVRKVMRFSGPRLLIRHPILVVQHLLESKREKAKMLKESKASDEKLKNNNRL